MGDRISIQFQRDNDMSVVLFHHWGGIEFRDTVRHYANTLTAYDNATHPRVFDPINRREPNFIMVDFIRWLFEGKCTDDNIYLGATE